MWFVSDERDVGCDRYAIEERSLKKGDEVK